MSEALHLLAGSAAQSLTGPSQARAAVLSMIATIAHQGQRAVLSALLVLLLSAEIANACAPARPDDPPLPALESIYLVVADNTVERPDGYVRLDVIERYHGPQRSHVIAGEPQENLLAEIGDERWIAGFNAPTDGVQLVHRLSGCFPLLYRESAYSTQQLQKLLTVLGLESAK